MFGRRIRLFRLMGFDVYIDPSWVVLAALIVWTLARGYFPYDQPGLAVSTYWWMGVLGALGLFASIIVHEFAHSLVARQYGMPMKGITLFIFGGVAEMEEEPPTARAELMTAVVGPLTSIGVGLAAYGASTATGPYQAILPVTAVLTYLGTINLVLAVFNLIPAFPLDGGRVLRAILWGWKGDLTGATRTTTSIGGGFGAFLMIMGVVNAFIFGSLIAGVWSFLIGLFLRNAANVALVRMEVRQALEGVPVDHLMRRDVPAVEPTLPVERFLEGHVLRHPHRLYAVTADDGIVGVIHLSRFGKFPPESLEHRLLRDLMEPISDRNSISSGAEAMDALERMQQNRGDGLIVIDNGTASGILRVSDLADFLYLKLQFQAGAGDERMRRQLVESVRAGVS